MVVSIGMILQGDNTLSYHMSLHALTQHAHILDFLRVKQDKLSKNVGHQPTGRIDFLDDRLYFAGPHGGRLLEASSIQSEVLKSRKGKIDHRSVTSFEFHIGNCSCRDCDELAHIYGVVRFRISGSKSNELLLYATRKMS